MLKLIPEWRKAGRMLSMQCMAAAIALQGAYESMPTELQQAIPPKLIHVVTGALLGLGMIGRLVRQKKVSAPKEPDHAG